MSDAAAIFYGFPRVIDLSLDRMRAALAVLGDPHLALPPTVHVAGTNGKGSTIAFLRAMLEAAGRRVHVYTSPHLVRIEERWRLAGTLIAPDRLEALARRVAEAARTAPLTIFEAETVAGFLAFAETPADALLLEVGLGGRLDATNVIPPPALSLITPVDFDHKEFLGDTIGQIAGEKAGIIKPGTPCLVGPQRPGAVDVIEARAAAAGAPLSLFGRDWDAWSERGRLLVQTGDTLLDLSAPALPGRHQIVNAGLAAVAALNLALPDSAIAAGVEQARWPARMQRLKEGPFAQVVQAAGGELWLDGGHNPHGAAAAAAFIETLQARDPRPLGLVFGLLANKDHAGFLQAFAPLAPLASAVPVRSAPGGAAPGDLARAALGFGIAAEAADSPMEGLAALVSRLGPRPRVLICGSLYLAGDVLSAGPVLD